MPCILARISRRRCGFSVCTEYSLRGTEPQKVSRCVMLDREGFRPNVGIILLNSHNEVWWGKRVREHSWQFPQGGIKFGETPEQAMYRELNEEIGLKAEHVKI